MEKVTLEAAKNAMYFLAPWQAFDVDLPIRI